MTDKPKKKSTVRKKIAKKTAAPAEPIHKPKRIIIEGPGGYRHFIETGPRTLIKMPSRDV